MTMTTRRTAALGGLLAAAAAPLIALSTSAIAGADPNGLYEDSTDQWGTSGSFGAPDSYNYDFTGTPGTENLVGNLDIAGSGIDNPIGTFSESDQTVSLGGTSYLYSDNSTDTYQDIVGGTPNGDSIVQDYSSVWDTSNSGSTFTELSGSDFTETLNSAGSVINIADTIDLFGHSFTLFDIPL